MMRRALVISFVFIAVCALLAVAAEMVTVVVGKTSIRKDRQPFAPAVAEAVYTDRLAVIGGEERGWLKVRHKGVEGWIHKTAVTVKKPEVSSRESGERVGSDEIALAGKGFDREVEDSYRRKHPDMNYAAVDRMENLNVSETALIAFVREGNLGGKELSP